jgi:hypothetical protein
MCLYTPRLACKKVLCGDRQDENGELDPLNATHSLSLAWCVQPLKAIS